MNEDKSTVKKIIQKRTRKDGQIEFEVEWENTWETQETLEKVAYSLLQDYLQHSESGEDEIKDKKIMCNVKGNDEMGLDDLFSSTSHRSSLLSKSRKSAGVGINAIISRLQKTQKKELSMQPSKPEMNADVESCGDDQPRVYGVTGSAIKNINNSNEDDLNKTYIPNYPLSPIEAKEANDCGVVPSRNATSTYYPQISPSRYNVKENSSYYKVSTSSHPSLHSSVSRSTSNISQSDDQKDLHTMYGQRKQSVKEADVHLFKCAICSEAFYEQSKFKQHMFMHDQVSLLKQDPPRLLKPGTYQCKFCSLLFDDKDKLKLHYSEEHEEEYVNTQPIDQLYKCLICPLTFVEHDKFIQHSVVHGIPKKEVFILPKNDVEGTTTTSDRQSSGNDIPSSTMLKPGDDDNVFVEHQTKILTSNPNEAMTTLDFRPVNEVLLSKTSTLQSVSLEEKKMYRCNICDELFETEGDRANHSLVHVNRSSSLDCHICGKQFKHRTNLSTHLVVHSGVKPHQCNVCLRRFTQKVNLQRHMHIHDGSRPFACRFCHKSFTQRANLQRHILSHAEHSKDDLINALNEIPNESEVNNAINENLSETKIGIMDNRTADKPEYRCHICDKAFAQKVNLQKHMLIHTGSRPFQCYVCGKTFRQRASLQKHYTIHTNGSTSFICQTCNRLFVSRTNLQRHMLVHVGPGAKQCYLCDRKFTTTDNLERHFSEHIEESSPNISLPQKYFEQSTPGQTFRCAVCDITFDSPIIFSQHLQCHQAGFSPDTATICLEDITKGYQENQSCKLQCNTCGLIVMSVAKLETHMTTHAESKPGAKGRQHVIGVMISPETPNNKMGVLDQPAIVIKQEEAVSAKSPTNRVSRCPVCKEMFSSKTEMREHYSSVHLENKNEQSMAITPPTSGTMLLQFEGTKYIATPLLTQPPAVRTMSVDLDADETSELITESEELLIKENEDFIKDNILGGPMEYETKGRYERGNYSCKICNRVLTYKYSLEKHMLLHASSFPYKCNICSRRFSNKASLDKHLIVHNGEKPFVCHICQRPFSQRSNLQRHQLTHTQNRDFICEVCGKRFNHMASLKTHSLIHTGAKPFACFICNKRFNQKGNLKRHVQTHRSGKRNKVNGIESNENFEEQIRTAEIAAEKCDEIDFDDITPDVTPEKEDAADLRRSCRSRVKRPLNEYDYEEEPLPTMLRVKDEAVKSEECNENSYNNLSSEIPSFEMTEEDILTVVPSDALEESVSMTTKRSPAQQSRERPKKQTYPCDSCSKLFISADSLEAHKSSTHHIICDVCGKKFSQKANLLKHKLIHQNKKPFECNVCHKAFRQKANLQRHELIHNKDRKTVNCLVCQKAFRCTWSLKQHMKGHNAESAETFGCSICGKTFRRKEALQKHLSMHKQDNNNEGEVEIMNGDFEDSATMVTKENNNNDSSLNHVGSDENDDDDDDADDDDDDDVLTVVTNESYGIQVQ